MKIKRINNLKVGCYTFSVKWNKKHNGGCFSYGGMFIEIGTKGRSNDEVFMILCHELMEIVAIQFHVRLQRPDCNSDYLFVYDHRQHDSMMNMFSGLLSQFIK